MGYFLHRSMVVIGHFGDKDSINEARDKAKSLGLQATPEVVTAVNGWRTFMVASSGSKMGWREYEEHERAINLFRDWLSVNAHCSWAVVEMPEDGDAAVTSCDRSRL